MFAKLSNKVSKKPILNPLLNWQASNEADLHNSMITEFIYNHGIKTRYIRRVMDSPDFVFGEDSTNKFEGAMEVSMFLESFEKYSGQGQMYSNFGYQMKDEAEFLINIDQFKQQGDGQEPVEGDLVYIQMTNALFEIKYIDPEEFFYQFGNLPVRRLMCQKFTYSHEDIDSTVVDTDENEISIVEQLKNLNELTTFGEDETQQVEQLDGFINFDPSDPFGNGYGDLK